MPDKTYRRKGGGGPAAGAAGRALGCCVLLLAFCLPALGREITVAAAADLHFALREIAARYEAQTGQTVRLSFGSSGNLYAQVRHGAPFDLFFSADQSYPRMLAEAGHADAQSLRVYGIGRLVLWTPGTRLNPEAEKMELLRAREVRRIAIANPRHAPYGRAAVEALKHFRVYQEVEKKLILGEQVSQAAQFVESGNAHAGLIALALALSPTMQGRGRYWLVPEEAHAPLMQAVVIPTSAPNREGARRFLEFVFQPESVAILQRYGFVVPEAAR
jgi:molybdate transport system substrate-binding protein